MSCDRVQPKARAVALHGEEAEGWWEAVRCVYPAEHEGLCSWEDHPADYQRRVEEYALPQHKPEVLSERNRRERRRMKRMVGDRKSTRLNSSHPSISYAVFCLKK